MVCLLVKLSVGMFGDKNMYRSSLLWCNSNLQLQSWNQQKPSNFPFSLFDSACLCTTLWSFPPAVMQLRRFRLLVPPESVRRDLWEQDTRNSKSQHRSRSWSNVCLGLNKRQQHSHGKQKGEFQLRLDELNVELFVCLFVCLVVCETQAEPVVLS